MKLLLKKATTSQTALIFVPDSSSSTGAGLTGLAWNSASLSWYYYREAAGTGATAVTLATQAIGTWATGGFVELDATNMPGWYEIGIPDAVLATGVKFVGMQLKGATNMGPVDIEIQLTGVDLSDGVRGGMTALPNAAADGAGGLPISDLGGLDFDALNTAAVRLTAARAQVLDDWINAGRLDAILDLVAADVVNIDGAAMRGTDSASLASVLGALTDAAAAGDPTTSDTLMQYIKQLINILIGTAGVVTFPAEAAPASGVSLAEVIRAIYVDVTGLNGAAMRGTDSAATAANLVTVDTVVDGIQTDLSNGTDGLGALKTLIDAIPTTAMRGTDSANTTTPPTVAAVADGVWDELLTGSSHNIATSAGKRLRQIEQAFVHASGTVASVGDSHTITLDTGAVATTDYYVGDRLQITEGTGAGQSRIVTAYTSGRVCTLDSDFLTDPDGSSLWELDAADVHAAVSDSDLAEGFVVTATSTTQLTLDAGAVATTDYYLGQEIIFTHGTGKGQARGITGYTSGRVVTMSPALATAVVAGTAYHIQAAVSIPEIVDEVHDEARADHVLSGSFGQCFGQIISGAAEAGTLTITQMTTDLTEATDDHYNGRLIVWQTGVLAGQASDITDYLGSTGMLTYTAVTEAPSSTDKFLIY